MTTKIEWAEETWNPITGCTRISPGCDRCYIERTPPFRMAGRRFHRPGTGGTTGVQLHPERLGQPLRWRKPRRIFVCSMADLFHDSVPDDHIVRVWQVMAETPEHTYQVLTKRPGRMRSLLSAAWFREEIVTSCLLRGDEWPLANVWLGVSAENQYWAGIRIPVLLDTPAAVRWISAEPLLGPIDLHANDDGMHNWLPDYGPVYGDPDAPICQAHGIPECGQGCRFIDWVVAGGESGPGARPMHPQWARGLRDQCQGAGVPFLFKQWGEWAPDGYDDEHGWHANIPRAATDPRRLVIHQAGMTAMHPGNPFNPFERGHPGWAMAMRRVGKKAAGRMLDGLTWDEYPQAVTA